MGIFHCYISGHSIQELFMRRKIIAVIIFVLVFGGTEGWFLWKQKQVNQEIGKRLKEAQSKAILFLGNSHMHFGLNPRKRPDALNLAYPSELFLFTYLKIKLLQPKVAIVALNPQHLQKNNEDALGNGLLSEVQYRYLYQKLSVKEQTQFYQHTPFEQWAFFKTSQWLPFLGNRLKSVNTDELLGTYKSHVNRHKTSPQDIKLRMQTVFEHYDYAQSALQLIYLKKMVAYSSRHNIKLIFVGFPVHPDFYKKISPKTFTEFQHSLKNLKKAGKFDYWNYSRQFTNKDYFYDPDHLNQKGGRVFSQIILQRLKNLKLR